MQENAQGAFSAHKTVALTCCSLMKGRLEAIISGLTVGNGSSFSESRKMQPGPLQQMVPRPKRAHLVKRRCHHLAT